MLEHIIEHQGANTTAIWGCIIVISIVGSMYFNVKKIKVKGDTKYDAMGDIVICIKVTPFFHHLIQRTLYKGHLSDTYNNAKNYLSQISVF